MTESWGAYRPHWPARACIEALRRETLGKVLRRNLGYLLKQISPYCDVEIEGIKLRCHVGDNGTEMGAIVHGEQQDATELKLIVGDLTSGNIFVDVGANCGLFTLFAAKKVGDCGGVIAIEPLPNMVDRLKFNIQANGFRNVRIFQTAIGAAVGTDMLFVRKRQHGRSTMSPPEGKRGYALWLWR